MPDDTATTPIDLTAPIMPTGSGAVDLEIAREEVEMAAAGSKRGPRGYWEQHAELHRKHDDENPAPEAPIRLATTKTADGTLGDLVDRWSALPDAERPRYVIHLGGGSLTYFTLESFRQHPRDPAR